MYLKKIKLAGFKSFVDPTTVLIPSHLVAIVGPNGCGKSNIIDAVCWVMGESSAKYLRGESLTDVIFNGSSARKPVGQASVELIFDNQDGAVGGEYASYAEVSIRRQINRDSESTYFLNGTRCRRRDIIDIFLGTGLGPRSYSIIGQNMISRIIESKPDDMRVYLEEAAGISKYKERRRETENRIQHTKENLARLNDVRAELEKQLNTLKRQATAAEKYKLLKQDERTLRAQWHAIQWRHIDMRLVDYTLQIQQHETGLEARQTEIGEINLTLEYKREEQRMASEAFQEVQRRFYVAGNDITRLEQDIHHHQARRQQWETDLKQAADDWLAVKNHLEETTQELEDLTEEIYQLTPETTAATAAVEESELELTQAEETMQEWQNQWDEFNQQTAQTTQTAQVEQTRIQHLEQKIASLKQRQLKLQQDQAQFDFIPLENTINLLTQQVSAATEQIDEYNHQLDSLRQELSTQNTAQQQTTQRLDQVRNELQQARGQQASLEALQQTALGQRNNRVIQWLETHHLDKQPRLAQEMEVETGWEYAVEKILGAHLQAICVEQLSDIVNLIPEFKEGSLTVLAKANKTTAGTHAASLLNKVKSQWPLDAFLAGIYTAESQTEALTLAESLAPHESVITRDGLWLGATWMRIARDENPAAGVFQREQELKQLNQTIADCVVIQDELTATLTQIREQLQTLETQRETLQRSANQSHNQLADARAQQKMQQERLADAKIRAERDSQEQTECQEQLEQAQEDLIHTREVWQTAMTEMEQNATARQTLSQKREQLRDHLLAVRSQSGQLKDHAHQLEIRLETTKSQQASLQQTLNRLQIQQTSLSERKQQLQKELDNASSATELEKDLAAALTHRLGIENELNDTRNGMNEINHAMQGFDNKRLEIEREIIKLRDMLETLRVESQGLRVKSESLLEQIKETNIQLETVLQQLPEGASAENWHAQLEQITQRISRLGPINLIAIEEFSSCSERKQYLDKQNDDLTEGLTTLENAIAKIDKETRARFKETFDKVNERFQELFPKVFGGGRAYLDLTGENLLDAGVSVMACPPGKRNSTIHLLSGGEKAMTAIALVFSIFHLNPAPFCLLDEVDAPLDDANIGRFCALVKEMSAKTQFIFISHNKLAIEMGEHLMGVTMHEPGVSRLVTVDVQQAIHLAGA